MARHAAPVSIRRNMLAPSEAVGRAGSMAACMGSGSRHVGRTKAHRVGPSADRRDLPSREKRGDAVGLTKRGKGSKTEVLVSGEGIPLAAVNAPASVGETRLVEPLLKQLIATAQTDEKFWPQRIVGDKAYDSDPLREQVASVGIELLAPHRSNRTEQSRTNDGRKMRRNKRRWKSRAVLCLGWRLPQIPHEVRATQDDHQRSNQCGLSRHRYEAFMKPTLNGSPGF